MASISFQPATRLLSRYTTTDCAEMFCVTGTTKSRGARPPVAVPSQRTTSWSPTLAVTLLMAPGLKDSRMRTSESHTGRSNPAHNHSVPLPSAWSVAQAVGRSPERSVSGAPRICSGPHERAVLLVATTSAGGAGSSVGGGAGLKGLYSGTAAREGFDA